MTGTRIVYYASFVLSAPFYAIAWACYGTAWGVQWAGDRIHDNTTYKLWQRMHLDKIDERAAETFMEAAPGCIFLNDSITGCFSKATDTGRFPCDKPNCTNRPKSEPTERLRFPEWKCPECGASISWSPSRRKCEECGYIPKGISETNDPSGGLQ